VAAGRNLKVYPWEVSQARKQQERIIETMVKHTYGEALPDSKEINLRFWKGKGRKLSGVDDRGIKDQKDTASSNRCARLGLGKSPRGERRKKSCWNPDTATGASAHATIGSERAIRRLSPSNREVH